MAKRGATRELTDRNWDQEEEDEEAGEFAKASEDTLKSRQIIKAKRRTAAEPVEKKSAFAGFGGFKPTQTSTPLFTGGFFKTESKISAEEKKEETKTISADTMAKPSTNGSENKLTTGSASHTTYLSNLKSLNMSVMNWISQHLEKNPYCILSPIFKDYESHLKKLEAEREKVAESGTNGTTAELKKEESVKPMDEDKPELPKTGLTFGMGTLQTKSGSTSTAFPGFSFKPSTTTSGLSGTAPGGFSFATGFSGAPAGSQDDGTKGDDEEYVPPVTETVEHKEEGSLYSKKCKLFYQKDGEWKDRGVGFLHLKKTDNKAQLLVRADTTLGNILLNVRLMDTMPMSRQGKNNVSLMCVVSPPIPKMAADKPIPMLIRVKSSEEADELLEKMKEISS
ncbi:nuclear pore complex protein Nup50-like [Dreissena polymorpha]|uniref:RanBD1 domain-containing protein n=1 Tax=Dreissena polymorpha TaxID=45954 RepID=A0A9D4RSV9_DREPO|nr:nuclear pore complex protein Nup50-like [Dreissena polymorpha]XP_052271666.1 nuclear pore complex protein Nup50-like [Dreissena polymorpha]KAH3877588.1 hypothetical protein DPMN_001463 [Dreissena polymorpha]